MPAAVLRWSIVSNIVISRWFSPATTSLGKPAADPAFSPTPLVNPASISVTNIFRQGPMNTVAWPPLEPNPAWFLQKVTVGIYRVLFAAETGLHPVNYWQLLKNKHATYCCLAQNSGLDKFVVTNSDFTFGGALVPVVAAGTRSSTSCGARYSALAQATLSSGSRSHLACLVRSRQQLPAPTPVDQCALLSGTNGL
jgi:hypothetical protein